MKLFNNIFNTNKIDCPRCLGKGNVDWDDIKRLKQELKWAPGPCAYCNAKGKVNPKIQSKVAVDNSYLTTDLSAIERNLLLNNNPEALERGHLFDKRVNDLIMQVKYLYFEGKMNTKNISEFYFLPSTESTESEKEEFEQYIKKIIDHKVD